MSFMKSTMRATTRISASRHCSIPRAAAPTTGCSRSPMPAWPITMKRAGPAIPGSIRTTLPIRGCRAPRAPRSEFCYAAGMSWFDQRPDDAMMGSFEAVGAEHIATVEPAQFREAMSQLGAAVHVVTTAGPAGTAGFTATAGCSVSGQPADFLGWPHPPRQVTPLLHPQPVLCGHTFRAGTDAGADGVAGAPR